MKNLLLKTIYGEFEVQEPLIELINTKAVQRLKGIHQRGISDYVDNKHSNFVSRYDHSIGVLALLIKYNADIKTQIAGLLHDVSHTVFSHVGDFIFKHKGHKSSYQDDIHKWILEQQNLENNLQKYKISLDEIVHTNSFHRILEQDLPDICADRLDYCLEQAYHESLITDQDITDILNDLEYKRENWFFSNIIIAKEFANIPLYLIENDWANPFYIYSYKELAKALRYSLELNIITKNDIHFSIDDIVLDKLKNSNNVKIQEHLNRSLNPKKHIELSTTKDYDKILYGKFRGIDPLINTSTGLKRLTSIDKEFLEKYKHTKNFILDGSPIKFL